MGKLNFWLQRRIRGWDDSDTWNLAYPIATFALPRMKRYREFVVDENCVAGHPGQITHQEWIEIIDKVIYSLDWIIREMEGNIEATEEGGKRFDRIQEGFSLFGQYFIDFGW